MSRLTNGRLRVFAVLAAVALAAAACGSSKKSNSTTGTTAAGGSGGSSGAHLKIGFFGALTGPNAQLGINEFNGEKLAIDQHNKKGGTQVDLVQYDSQGDPAQAPQLAQKVISDKDVAIVGPAFSGESKAADPIFEQAGIPNITASATNPALADNGWKFFHRAVGNDNSQGPAAAKFIEKSLKAKNCGGHRRQRGVQPRHRQHRADHAEERRRQRGGQRPHRQERPGLLGHGQQGEAGQRGRHLLRRLLLRGRPLPQAAS